MIIVNGVNFFAEDVEAVVQGVPGVYRRRCVAVPGDAERMVVIAEARGAADAKGADGLAERIRARIAAELALAAVDVVLTKPGSLPRTTSGKWQRGLVATT